MEPTREQILRAAIDVLPETLLAFKNEGLYGESRTVIESAIMQSPNDEPRAIMQFGADALEQLIDKSGSRSGESSRTFLAKIKGELGME